MSGVARGFKLLLLMLNMVTPCINSLSFCEIPHFFRKLHEFGKNNRNSFERLRTSLTFAGSGADLVNYRQKLTVLKTEKLHAESLRSLIALPTLFS